MPAAYIRMADTPMATHHDKARRDLTDSFRSAASRNDFFQEALVEERADLWFIRCLKICS
jgi:hypothetical protein